MNKTYLLLLVTSFAACSNVPKYGPSDTNATAETKQLYYSMQKLVSEGVLFGHHDDTGYGVGWKLDDDSSDVKNTVGTYPAVYGWDLAKMEHDSTLDINNFPFAVQKKRIREAYERGGINTFCWHMDNPADGKTAWDTTQHTIAAIIPGGASHQIYLQYLDNAAKYLGDLRGKDTERIPVLFRPFHELTGNWFWWGKNTSTPAEFKTLWRFTIDYLRNKKGLHNLLIVYSVADFNSEKEFMERYPGDDYVDFVGFDSYCQGDVNVFARNLDRRLTLIDTIAARHHKLPCLAETGYMNIPQADWWTKVLLPVISKHQLSYMLLWRNAGMGQFFVPYPTQKSESDFKTFSTSENVIFQNKLTPQEVYGKPDQ